MYYDNDDDTAKINSTSADRFEDEEFRSGQPKSLYPIIELPNPAAGVEGAEPMVYVYRHWTHAEMIGSRRGAASLKREQRGALGNFDY